MKTIFLLMARHEGLPIIPVEIVCRDYLTHLSPEKLVRKISNGEIQLPLVRLGTGQKAAKGIHIEDLAYYLDKQRERARDDCRKLGSAT